MKLKSILALMAIGALVPLVDALAEPPPLFIGATCQHVALGKAATNDSTWNCEGLGELTVKQIYEKGYRVVSTLVTLVPGSTNQRVLLIIEKPLK